MSKRVITINRMLGSNGRLIGKTLAEELGFAFYDKELIDIAAHKENIPFDILAKVDEKRGSNWRFPIDHELQMDSDFHFVPMNDVLFDLQRFPYRSEHHPAPSYRKSRPADGGVLPVSAYLPEILR